MTTTTTTTSSMVPVLNQQSVEIPSHSLEEMNSSQTERVTVTTSKEWVLPPRPKPGRKLKEIKAKQKCNIKPSPTSSAISASNIPASTKKSPSAKQSTNRKSNKKSDCCANELNPDLSTVSSLLQNISIIDSENSCLKSNLLCLIHEYKHLKNLVLSAPSTTTESSNTNTPATTTTATGTTATRTGSITSDLAIDSLPDNLTEIVDSMSHEVRAVHKRSFVEVCEEDKDLFSEIEHIIEEGEPSRRMSAPASRASLSSSISTTNSTSASSPIATIMGYNSSTVDTVASTPSPATLEFEQFINIDQLDDKKETSMSSTPDSTSTYRSKKFAHYKDFHKLDTEEDSDGDINFEDDDLINGGGGEEEEDDFLGELCTPSSTSSHDLSRTTSPYSDYETNSLMSTLTRTTTGSSINTVIHEKPSFASDKLHNNSSSGYTSIHPPPLTLKKMGNFFDLPKYQENDKLYSFKFDTAEYQAKRIDDEYNLVTDLLEEKLMSNEIHYYLQQE